MVHILLIGGETMYFATVTQEDNEKKPQVEVVTKT